VPVTTTLPPIIQGGMGVGVSNWVLARAVSLRGQLGVVSGVGLDTLFVRRLQDGDPGGHLRRAIGHFPIPDAGKGILARYFRPGGCNGAGYAMLPMYDDRSAARRHLVAVLANFVEVFLAKEGHDGLVGINLLTKIQPPTLPSLYGAMLAGVSFVLMGAGIPREIPAALDRLAGHDPAAVRYDVLGGGEATNLTFDPRTLWPRPPEPLARPGFIAIVASNSLAAMLARKATGRVDGFVVEGPTAGGHNAPPRGTPRFNERGEPIYGERDAVDLDEMRKLGLPFWLAGGMGSPAALAAALAAGAAGIQVGTLFAFCEESGLHPEFKYAALAGAREERLDVVTDPRASPTGYPFKVVRVAGVPSSNGERVRVCDLGYLRTAYRRDDGRVGHRCPGEPVDAYVQKGGDARDAVGRHCLCNALLANAGKGQMRAGGGRELPLLTSGDDLRTIGAFLGGRERYSAADVLDHLLGAPA
jgi:NAD(P)H-dependent flavin oxidoreductase YrpB (nitropropane dioxygenase family)